MCTTNSQICSKKPRMLSNYVGKDYISNLPDSVISHILSRLPTKDAAQTSILSKDWQFKWYSIDNVNISDVASDPEVSEFLWKYYTLPEIRDNNELHKRAMQSRKAANLLKAIKSIPISYNVRSFTVYWWGSFYTGRLSAWISAVINPNIETFRLLYPWTGVVLPRSLLECTSLRNLELKLPSVWRVPVIIDSFSNLIDLSLHSVEILNEDISSDTLIFKFEMLTTFKMYHCNLLNVKFVEIHAPALTTFKWSCCRGVDAHLIKIIGAQPVVFEIHDLDLFGRDRLLLHER